MYEKLVNKLRRCGKGLCTEDCPDWTKENLYHTCQDEVVLEAADAIENSSKAYQMMAEAYEAEVTKQGWTPVSERLPGREWVLCKCRAKIYEVLSLRDGYWYHDPQHQYMSGFVTHWMPLPPAPKEEI